MVVFVDTPPEIPKLFCCPATSDTTTMYITRLLDEPDIAAKYLRLCTTDIGASLTSWRTIHHLSSARYPQRRISTCCVRQMTLQIS